jgi:hypothetical protein
VLKAKILLDLSASIERADPLSVSTEAGYIMLSQLAADSSSRPRLMRFSRTPTISERRRADKPGNPAAASRKRSQPSKPRATSATP